MNETNISNWTVDSEHDRSFLPPATYHASDPLMISNCSRSPISEPPKTRTHRPSASYHSNLDEIESKTSNEKDNKQNDIVYNSKQIEMHHKNGADFPPDALQNELLQTSQHGESEAHHMKQQTISSLTTYTNTYVHPLDRNQFASNEDEKDQQTADIESISTPNTIRTTDGNIEDTDTKRTPLIHQALNDTMDYTSKLMATIQQMQEQNDLKYKLRKYALKIKKLERQLLDEKALHENKAAFLEKINGELTQTNVEIERIEREKRALNESLKQLQDVEQQKRLLEMKNLQLMQQQKLKDSEIDTLNKQLMEHKMKLQRTLEDRDSISAVSETMREELTNKRAAIIRYKEIQKKLNDKIHKYELNENKLSDTMYSAPDATKLYFKMNELERDTNLAQNIKDLQTKYNTQSREFMQLKLKHQSLQHNNERLKKKNEALGFSDKWKKERNAKNKLLNDLQGLKTKYNVNVKQLKKDILSKNTDIERLKSAIFHMNKFIANQHKHSTTKDINETVITVMDQVEKGINMNNVTSLSFEHDLDLEAALCDNTEVESTKSHIVRSKKMSKKDTKSLRSKSSIQYNDKLSSSNNDLLDDITAMVTNEKRSKSKGKDTKYRKRNKYNKSGSNNNARRQFIPSSKHDTHARYDSRARRIALSKKRKKSTNNDPGSERNNSIQSSSV